MKSLKILFPILIVAIVTSCCSKGLSEKEALELIDKDEILANVLILSDDDMEGRFPATEGEIKATNFIARQFKDNALSPINGSYFQTLNMISSKKINEVSYLTINSQGNDLEYESDINLTYNSLSNKEIVDMEEVPLIFVGYGVEAPEYQWDDFKGLDLNGKVLLFLNDDPPVTENGAELFKGEIRTYYGRWTYKLEQAKKHGAKGAIIIHTTKSASYPFSVLQHVGSMESFALESTKINSGLDLVVFVDSVRSNIIAETMGTNLPGLFELSASRDFKPMDTGYKISAHIESYIKPVQTKNVWGMLQGSDQILKDQYIIITAHHDHLGINEDLPGDDKIYNGAWDNATGVASTISLAKAFSALKEKPKRSIIFLACAAEEVGWLGGEWFVNNPPFELKQLVANFNIDCPQIFGLTSDISAIGLDMSSLGNILREVVQKYNIEKSHENGFELDLVGDLYPNAGRFYRSDQISFAKAGIPAIHIKPGAHYLKTIDIDIDEYGMTHYHQVNDEVNDAWDLTGCERDMKIQFMTIQEVANNKEMPRWLKGNEFEDEWMKLHGVSN